MRIIDYDHCPSNVRTFTAKDFSEAVIKADRLMRERDVQSVVWLREDFQSSVHPSVDDLYYLNTVSTDSTNRNKVRFQVSASFTNNDLRLEPDVPLVRGQFSKKVVAALAEHFDLWYATIRLMEYTLPDIHIDKLPPEKNGLKIEDSLLFWGCIIRILEFNGHAGVRIYDPKELDQDSYEAYLEEDFNIHALNRLIMPEPWHVRSTDVAFLTNTSWPARKVVLHAEPLFEDASKPRVIGIYEGAQLRFR